MAYNHFRLKDLNRRRYVFTKTKAFFAFLLSVFFSVILSAFYERHGDTLFKQLKKVVVEARTGLAETTAPAARQKAGVDLRNKLNELTGARPPVQQRTADKTPGI